jgi:glycosyltransferase involved in cell wall biosynthesis
MLAPWSLAHKHKKKMAFLPIWRWQINQASAVHVLNKEEEKQVRMLGVTAPTVEIPNGVFPQDLIPLPASNDPPINKGRPYVLFLGRLHPVKGLDVLASAFARVCSRVSDLDLLVVGPDAGFQSKFESMVRQFGIEDRVRILGPIYDERKRRILHDAVCLCQLSYQEAFSMTIVEAIGLGIPVVISEECHFPEIAVARAGRIVARDSAQIAEAICWYANDVSRRVEAGAAGRRLVSERYLWPSIAKHSIQIYEHLPGYRQHG